DRRAAEVFDPHAGKAVAVELQRLGGPDRQVDDAIADIGTAVVHPHHDRAAVVQVGDAGIARQRHGGVRGRDGVHVVDFDVGGQPAVEIRPVPGRGALGAVVRVFLRDVGAAVDAVGSAYAVAAAAFRHRLALLDHPLAVLHLPTDRGAGAVGHQGAGE